jgi:hypothetical protein
VENGQQLHGGVGYFGEEEEKQEVDRIKQARLVVGDEGGTAVEVRVPQGDDTSPEIAGCKVIDGVKEGDQVAATGGHPGITGEEELPEETEGS